MLLSSSWLLVYLLFKGKKEVQEVDGFADFVLGLYKHLEREPSGPVNPGENTTACTPSNRYLDIATDKNAADAPASPVI